MNRLSNWPGVAGLAVLYFATAKLGIELSVAQGVVTPVWIPTGLSLAALLVFGYRLWPGVALGAFAANVTSDVSVFVAVAIAVGNSLEALFGTYLLRRFDFDTSLGRVRDVLALAVLGAGISTTIAATTGTTTLLVGGEIDTLEYLSRWSLWWFGDAMGALLVAPLLLVCFSRSWFPRERGLVETFGLLAVLIAASSAVFVGGSWRYPYLLFPLLVWATLRFRQLGATGAVFVISVIAVFGTVRGSVPIGGATPTQSVEILQALLAVVGVSTYVLAASLNERDVTDRELQIAHANLAEAQSLAHIGSWERDVRTSEVTWSDELYRIHGYQPLEFSPTTERAMERIDPQDRVRIENNLKDALAARAVEVPPIEYRVIRQDGARTLRERGAIRYSADGRPLRIVGTVQDITEQRRADERERFVRDAELRHKQALALNDTIVQGLVAAKTAFDLDLRDKHEEFLINTLKRAKELVSRLLDDAGRTKPLGPGDFVREEPTRLNDQAAE